MRIRFTLAGCALALLAAGCGIAGGAEATDPSRVDLVITAEAMAFDASELELPAGRPLSVLFRNRDGALHNVAIYRDGEDGESVFAGELIGTGEVMYTLPPLEPGGYPFRCDLHPSMAGRIVVR